MNQRFFAGEASARQCDPNPTKPLTDVLRSGSESNEVGGWQQKLRAAARLSSGASLMSAHSHHHPPTTKQGCVSATKIEKIQFCRRSSLTVTVTLSRISIMWRHWASATGYMRRRLYFLRRVYCKLIVQPRRGIHLSVVLHSAEIMAAQVSACFNATAPETADKLEHKKTHKLLADIITQAAFVTCTAAFRINLTRLEATFGCGPSRIHAAQ